MAEKAQVILNWTPVNTATVQKIYRSSSSSSGPWTLVKTFNDGTTTTWTDTGVDPTPIKTYWYYIETTCSSGTSTSGVSFAVCTNCDEGQGNKSLFIFKNNITNDNVNEVEFTYVDRSKKYWNDTYGTSLTTTSSVAVGRTPITGYNKYIGCHTCGEPVTFQLSNFATLYGATTLNADYSHASDQNIEDFLPSSSSGFTTSYTLRAWDFDASNNSSLAHTVNNGYFWLGTTFSTNPTSFSALNPPTSYNLGELNANQLRISRLSDGNTNYSTPMSGFTSDANGTAYMLFRPFSATIDCIYWLFEVTRNSNYDVYSSGTLQMYGYDIVYRSSFVYDSTYFISLGDTTQWGHFPKNTVHPFTIKFFKTNQIA